MARYETAIITDSTCDILPALVEQYQITVLSHVVVWGSQQFRDRIEIQPVDFYLRLESDPVYPSTAHVTAHEFLEAVNAAAAAGAKSALILTVSSAMSGTYQAALTAAQQAPIPVQVIDSKGPTFSLGWQVLAAARAREAGADLRGAAAAADFARQSMVQLVAMDSIEYLYKGGRIGNAKRLLGAMLNIKPVVYIDHASGLVESYATARTHAKAVELLVRGFFERIDTSRPLHLAVLHGNVPDEAQALAERLQREYKPVELLINITGPVLGVNTGPRALALAGYTE